MKNKFLSIKFSIYDFFGIWRIFHFFESLNNFWIFRKEIYKWRSFDSSFHLIVLKKMLEVQEKNMRKNQHHEGWEEMCDKIKEAKELINNIIEDNFIEQAEKNLNRILTFKFCNKTEDEAENDRMIFREAERLETENEKKLLKIIFKHFNEWWD